MTRARVVGAGLSGLVAACCLAESGCEVEVVEAAAGPGGLIGTLQTPHGPVERAANAFVWNDASAKWFYRLGITPQFPERAAHRRYIFTRGRARRWPLSVGGSLSLAARLSVAVARRRARPIGEESVASFGERVAGQDATRHLLGPALQGIYGAPPEALCARVIFGGGRRGRRRFATPAAGMGEFIARLHEHVCEAGVTFSFGSRLDRLDPATPTIIATNAPDAARLLAVHAPTLSRALTATAMTSVVTTTAFFEPHADDLSGFGVLFPRDSGVAALGVLFNASIFAQRGHRRSETWIYGASGLGDVLPGDDGLVDQLMNDRLRLCGRSEPPLALHATRRSPALPIYGRAILGVQEHLGELPPWRALSGNYLGRIGVSALLEYAEEAAARILSVRT